MYQCKPKGPSRVDSNWFTGHRVHFWKLLMLVQLQIRRNSTGRMFELGFNLKREWQSPHSRNSNKYDDLKLINSILFWYYLTPCLQKSQFKYNNVTPLIIPIIAPLGNYGKLVAPGVPADPLALHLADGGQLTGCHSEHLHLGTPAGQQLSIGGEVDVVFC